ncbi:MAG TPA: homocysteine S-methyltransferase family protein [Bryobacteraceae bacterium]|nr:homocysteine S-methyltransferase family protein [Bryobacteraceae bacterium]
MLDKPTSVLLTGGALGTEYQRLGLERSSCPDLWVLDAPEHVFAVTRSYADAGSDLVLTTTFRANPISLAEYGRAADVVAVNETAVRIARVAAPGKAVLGDVGPIGRLGTDVERAFAIQCRALAHAGVDALVLETFTDVDEAAIALKAAQATGLRTVVSFSFGAAGLPPEEAAEKMTMLGAWSVGANCGTGLQDVHEICSRMRAVTPLPLWMKPSAGLPEIVEDQPRYSTTCEHFVSALRACVAAGAAFVGGCCGTTPQWIAAFHQSRSQ